MTNGDDITMPDSDLGRAAVACFQHAPIDEERLTAVLKQAGETGDIDTLQDVLNALLCDAHRRKMPLPADAMASGLESIVERTTDFWTLETCLFMGWAPLARVKNARVAAGFEACLGKMLSIAADTSEILSCARYLLFDDPRFQKCLVRAKAAAKGNGAWWEITQAQLEHCGKDVARIRPLLEEAETLATDWHDWEEIADWWRCPVKDQARAARCMERRDALLKAKRESYV
jgi:hypothetical protein